MAGPFTFGSSLTANGVPAIRSADWFVATRPFAMTGARVISNSITTSLAAGTEMFRTSTRPVPLAPPVALVLLPSAPAGTLTSASVPGANTGGVFRRSSSSVNDRFSSAVALRFAMRMW